MSEPTENLVVLVESLLFVAAGPTEVDRLAATLAVDAAAVEATLAELTRRGASGGVRLQRKGDQVQLVTAPEAAGAVERFLGRDQPVRLSSAALEALAIVAYQQPVTRARIEAVRGVNSDRAISTLLSRGLIEEVGRLETVGRPVVFGTTFQFLQYFGLASLAELPALGDDEGRRTKDEGR